MFIHSSSFATHLQTILKETNQCGGDLHFVILMNFIKLIWYTLQVFSLTFLYIAVSQQKSYINLVNVTQNRPTFKLMSGACCGKKGSNCDIECKIKFEICLFPINGIKTNCLINAEVKNPMSSPSFIVNLNKTVVVRIYFLFHLTFRLHFYCYEFSWNS